MHPSLPRFYPLLSYVPMVFELHLYLGACTLLCHSADIFEILPMVNNYAPTHYYTDTGGP